jgi:two-component system, NtrC family, sensor histidine kinase KinB
MGLFSAERDRPFRHPNLCGRNIACTLAAVKPESSIEIPAWRSFAIFIILWRFSGTTARALTPTRTFPGKAMRMKLSLREKILFGYGIALLLTAVVLAWSFVTLSRLGRASDAILQKNYASILAAHSMLDALDRQNSAILIFLLRSEKTESASFRANEAVFYQWLGRAKDNITEEGEGKIVADVERAYSSFLSVSEGAFVLSARSSGSPVGNYTAIIAPAFDSTRDTCLRLREINQRAMYRSSAEARRIASNAIFSTLAIGIAAIFLGLGFSFLLANLITQPLKKFMKAARDISNGDYAVRIPAGSSDELGHLAFEFNIMAEKLKIFHDMNIGRLIAEKKKSEAIVRSIDDGLIFVDAENRVLDINAPAAKLFGTEPSEAAGKHLLEVIRDERVFSWVKRAVEEGKPAAPPENEDIITLEKGETRVHYQFSVNPVTAESGANAGALIVLRDITRLKELDMLKSQFVLTASHELRTPLTSALMAVDLLAEKAPAALDDKGRQLLEAARQDLHRLRVLVNDLLELSKIESGKIDLAFESTPVHVIAEGAMNLLAEQSAQRKLELSYQPAGDLPPVKADPNKIVWVLTNLISNALRYTDPGGWIRISAERFGTQVHISVSDNGIGIPYEYQSRIFDKFVQVKTDRESGGSGLGLAICKEIVRAHGGAIWVDSTPGEGSRFTFTLPVFPESPGTLQKG